MEISDRDFERLWTHMLEQYGVNLEKKKKLIEGRLAAVVASEGYSGFSEYVDDALGDKSGEKAGQLLTKLTTNYTYFMREEAHYRYMADVALPEWTERIRDRDLRTWSAGCSTGAEAYTAAMVIDEWFGGRKLGWDTTILATDISPRVLEEARRAVYPAGALDKLPAAWKQKYFTKTAEGEWAVKDSLKREVSIGSVNLMGELRFKRKFHIIFCRNVMIYFNAETKAAVTDKFYDVLEPGGYLFIGLSETLTGVNDRFEQVRPAIYRK